MGVLLFLLMWRLGARPLVAVAAALTTTAVMVLIFQRVLLVPLPAGLLG
jgi:putative tricarboxylic transport membrane protein